MSAVLALAALVLAWVVVWLLPRLARCGGDLYGPDPRIAARYGGSRSWGDR